MRAAALLLLGATACGESTWRLPVPATGAAKSGVLAALDGETLVALEALDLEAHPFVGRALERSYARSVDRLDLWLYDAPFLALRVDEGTLVPTFAEGSEPLPDADAIVAAILDVSLWEPAAPSPLISNARVVTNFECPEVDIVDTTIDDRSTVETVAVTLSAESAFVQHADKSLLLHSDGRLEAVTATIPTASAPRAGYLAPDGDLWLVDAEGTVVRGDVERGFTRAPSARSLPNPRKIILDGPREGALELDLYIDNSTTAIVQRFDGTEWTVLAEAPTLVQPTGMHWIAPGEVLVHGFGPLPSDFRVLRGPQVRAYSVPFESGNSLFQARLVPGFGMVFIGTFGAILAWKDDSYTPLMGQFNTIADVAAFDDGLIMGGWRDTYTIYTRGRYCPVIGFSPLKFRSRILPMGDVYVLPRRLIDPGETPSIGILRRKPR